MKRLAKKYPEYFEGVDTNYPYQIYYNFEATTLNIKIKKGKSTVFEKKHLPISVSFKSNYDKINH